MMFQKAFIKIENTKAWTCMEQDFLTPTNIFQL
jgi:hypothetical protein